MTTENKTTKITVSEWHLIAGAVNSGQAQAWLGDDFITQVYAQEQGEHFWVIIFHPRRGEQRIAMENTQKLTIRWLIDRAEFDNAKAQFTRLQQQSGEG